MREPRLSTAMCACSSAVTTIAFIRSLAPFIFRTERRIRPGNRAWLALVVLCLPYHVPVQGRSLFEFTAQVDDDAPVSKGFSDAQEFFDQLRNENLLKLVPDYTEDSKVTARLDFRGLETTAAYKENSTALTYQVECSGTNKTFEGETRDDSQDMLVDFLESNSDEVTDIAKCLVSDSPVDPVAGNPNSLVANMAASDFRSGTVTDAGEENLVGIGLRGSWSESSDFNTWTASIPINYVLTIPNPKKPPYAVIFDLPIRYVNVEGGNVFDGSLGLGFRVPVLRRWALTPMVRVGLVGSADAGALQAAYSGTVTSKLDFYFADLRFSLNNFVGYYTTGSVKAGDYDVKYDLQNVIFRNGLALEGSLNYKLLDDPTSWEFQFVDTRITGDSWYNDWYDDVVVTVGTRRRATRMKWQDVRFGAKYTFAEDFNGFQFVMDYRF